MENKIMEMKQKTFNRRQAVLNLIQDKVLNYDTIMIMADTLLMTGDYVFNQEEYNAWQQYLSGNANNDDKDILISFVYDVLCLSNEVL